MQDQEANKKKRLKVLLFIIVAYIIVVSGIALYVKLNNAEQFVSDKSTIGDRLEVPKENQKILVEEVQPIVEDESIVFTTIEKSKADSSVEMADEDAFEREYAKYLGSSLADVPARALGQDAEEVLVASDLTLKFEKPKGFFERVVESIYAFFAGDTKKTQELSNETAAMLAETDAEIAEMQSHFSLYKENNGVTYIDHLNKPMMLESNGFYIYIGVAPNGFTFHRTIIRYSGVDEIDMQSILVQTSSTDRASIIKATDDILQKKITTAANEWVDLPPTQENNTLLNSVVSSDNVKVTFMGSKKNVEWTLTENEIITLKETLHFYNLLKEKEELSK